jgi:type 1 glutamine amidotransferase/nicotinamidase-related amidase
MPRTPLAIVGLLLAVVPASGDDAFTLHARTRVETAPGSGRYHTLVQPVTWDAAKTAVVVCDMWDKHWCPGATARVGEMAPRVNDVISAARKKGALVIHCPSDTMDFYKDTPQRKLAQSAPRVEPKVPLQRWCKLDAAKEGALPIDDSDGGCAETVKNYKAWTRQHEAIKIADGDAVTDSDEAYYLMLQRGITNVVVTGVHTNMCVLGRPFAIRQLVQQGLNVVLVRDLTDTMYNPAKAPFVSHFTGTDLVVEHIEKHWCPSVTSADFVGGSEFRFKDDRRPHLVIISAEDEYKTETTLPEFARTQLGKDFRVSHVFADAADRARLPGIDVLDSADAVLVSVRRRPLAKADLAAIHKFVASGKPVIGIRTASHAFAPKKGEKLPAGVEAWETFDTDVLGCHYANHYPGAQKTTIELTGMSPLLDGVSGFESSSSLYKSNPLVPGCTVLLTGKTGTNPVEPVAWTREKADGRGRVFYTSLGHPDDFKQPAFVALLKNGILWATETTKK